MACLAIKLYKTYGWENKTEFPVKLFLYQILLRENDIERKSNDILLEYWCANITMHMCMALTQHPCPITLIHFSSWA